MVATFWTWAFLLPALTALLLAGFFALLAISPSPVAIPSAQQLRHWWKRHAADPRPGTSGPQIAESLLNSSSLSAVSALSGAKGDADIRAQRFRYAIRSMFTALVFLVALLLNVLYLAWGR